VGRGRILIVSDPYECSTTIVNSKYALKIVGISYLREGITLDDVIRDIAVLVGVDANAVKKKIIVMSRRGNYTLSLKDLAEV